MKKQKKCHNVRKQSEVLKFFVESTIDRSMVDITGLGATGGPSAIPPPQGGGDGILGAEELKEIGELLSIPIEGPDDDAALDKWESIMKTLMPQIQQLAGQTTNQDFKNTYEELDATFQYFEGCPATEAGRQNRFDYEESCKISFLDLLKHSPSIPAQPQALPGSIRYKLLMFIMNGGFSSITPDMVQKEFPGFFNLAFYSEGFGTTYQDLVDAIYSGGNNTEAVYRAACAFIGTS